MFSHLEEEIVKSMARTLFVSAWADYHEERGRTFTGDLMDQAPPTPAVFLHAAYYLAGRVEQGNTRSLFFLLRDAKGADKKRVLLKLEPEDEKELTDEYAREFGSDLAMMLMGTGVSWFDDHEKFRLNLPLVSWSHLEFPDDCFT